MNCSKKVSDCEKTSVSYRLLSDKDESALRNENKESINSRIDNIEQGIANRRITAFCVLNYQWHETLRLLSKSDLIEHHLPMSRQEVYKEKSRAEYELIIFDGDVSKVGTIRASYLDYLRSIANKYYEHYQDKKFFLLGVWELIEKELIISSRSAIERYGYLTMNSIKNHVGSFLSLDENLKSRVQLQTDSERQRFRDQEGKQKHTDSLYTDSKNTVDMGKDERDGKKFPRSDNEKKALPCKTRSNDVAHKLPTKKFPNFANTDSSVELDRKEVRAAIEWFVRWLVVEHKELACRKMMKELFDEDARYIDLLLTDFKKTVSLEQYVKTLKTSINVAIGTSDKSNAA